MLLKRKTENTSFVEILHGNIDENIQIRPILANIDLMVDAV